MSGWVIAALPLAALAVLLVHDFLAGLGEDRLWSDPALDEMDELYGGRSHRRLAAVSMESVNRLQHGRPQVDAPLADYGHAESA